MLLLPAYLTDAKKNILVHFHTSTYSEMLAALLSPRILAKTIGFKGLNNCI